MSDSKNSATKDLLIEIGVEELPPKNLDTFARTFGEHLEKAFKNANLAFSNINTFIAPRRLAAIVKDLVCTQPEQILLKRGPAKAAAFDSQGKPTQAALGFAISCQTTIENVGIQETEKGSFLIFQQTLKGQKSEDLIPNIVQDVLHHLPLAKKMRWGDSSTFFVRPVHWVVLLFGDQVIPAEIFGIKTSDSTIGHRFHHPEGIALTAAKDYEAELFTKGKVIADYKKRRQYVEEKLIEVAAKLKEKSKALIDSDLLDQVTGLVEWPVVLVGQLDADFLALPKEVLISSMQVHQKCFPVINDKNELLPYFLVVSNIESIDPKTVIQGNECVMHARLHDATFYYQEDKKISLESRQEGLKQVVFQHGLGSLWDKAQRIAQLACIINKQMQGSESNEKIYMRLAGLCKSDLLTQMVMEFPELQGVMGRYYYLDQYQNQNSDKIKNSESSYLHTDIAKAIEEHYHPRFAQDTLPDSLFGAVIAIADRLDTLVALFGLGKRPTGDKDPFALRRQAMAVLRIIIEEERFEGLQHLDLQSLFTAARENYKTTESYSKLLPSAELNKSLLDFFYERLRAWYYEQGIPARVFDAVLAVGQSGKPKDFHHRLLAVTAFQKLPEAESLGAANKRVRNILEKSAESLMKNVPALAIGVSFDIHLLKEDAEKKLAKILQEKEAELEPLIEASHYAEALKSLAELKVPVDNFFDNVMVMVEDLALRNNRLALLMRLRNLFLEIADISVL